jgi:glycosyltransferase involved in cell wall biosynthesis|tara:strand:+ start:588 stop:1751 length:1164 start_codon:yes stop_codon:yes gene_type:complete
MKKILLIHNTYRNLGGEDIAVASEVEVLKKHYDIKELYFSNLDTGYISLLMTLFFNRSLKSENVVRKAITEYSPDLIYVHNTWFNASLGIFRVLQNSKVPIFLKIHNFRYYCTKTLSFKKHLKNEEYCPACGLKNRRLKILNSYFENSLFKSLLMNRYGLGYFKIIKDLNIKILVLTNFHKKFLNKLGITEDKVSVQQNFIPKINFDVVNDKNINTDKFIVYAGRVSKEKGVEELIETFLDCGFKDIALKIIGDGPSLDSLVKKYKENNIYFEGLLKNKDVKKIISNSIGVVTVTKLYEGQPTLLCEASSLGKISIFPDSGGIKEFFPPNYQYCFKSEDYDDLKNKLINLTQNYNNLDIGNNNKYFIQKILNEDRLLNNFEMIFNEG